VGVGQDSVRDRNYPRTAARHAGQVAANQPIADEPRTNKITVMMTRIRRRLSASWALTIGSTQLQDALLVEGHGTQRTTLESNLTTQSILDLIE
jgi:hypothetical protein